jgi:hypothetical protein
MPKKTKVNRQLRRLKSFKYLSMYQNRKSRNNKKNNIVRTMKKFYKDGGIKKILKKLREQDFLERLRTVEEADEAAAAAAREMAKAAAAAKAKEIAAIETAERDRIAKDTARKTELVGWEEYVNKLDAVPKEMIKTRPEISKRNFLQTHDIDYMDGHMIPHIKGIKGNRTRRSNRSNRK